jgi:putative endonuclease
LTGDTAPARSGQAGEWVVYILCCADDTLYTGITTDLARRLTEHNQDNRLGARYTHRAAALREEYRIKQLSRAQKQRLIAAAISD